MRLLRTFKAVSCLGLLALCGRAVNAAQIPINNPSFESPALAGGAFQSGAPTNWTVANGLTNLVVWNPGSTYPNYYYNSAPPGGNQILALGGNFSSGEVNQDLGVTLQANTVYTLTYWVGARNDIPISSYNVALLAGNTVLMADHQGNPNPGQFVKRTITFHSGSTSGGELSIDLLGTGRNYTAGVAGQVNLDLIQLDVAPDALSLACPAATGHRTVAYNSALLATGGLAPFTYSLSAGSLGGLTLNPATGAITGTPSASGVFTFTANVVDSASSPQGNASVDCSLTITDLATAVFLSKDDSTHGTWKGAYGADGYTIVGDSTSLPGYAQLNLTTPLPYTWLPSSQDANCLQHGAAQSTDRICSVWYSGSSFTVDVTITGGAQTIALYALDWDQSQRAERIDVFDGSNGIQLDSRTVSGFQTGTYLVWKINGHLQFKVTQVSGPNSVISGIFFGAGPGVIVAPQISQSPANASVNAGQTASFTVSATGTSPTYQWQSQPSGGSSFSNINGANSATYTTPVLLAADNGTQFRCMVSNGSGSATSAAATLTVTVVAPMITQNPANASVNAGSTASFSVAATGSTLAYQWQSQPSGGSGFSNIPGASAATYTTPVLTPSDSGTQFRCVVSNSAGSPTSTAATVTVTVAAPSIGQNPANASASVGQTAMFSVSATGSNLVFQWQSLPGGGSTFANISGANAAVYVTPALSLADNGTQFRCVVSNSVGPVNSTAATLTVTAVSINGASFISTDSSTSGTWKGTYGPDGFLIANDTTSPPAYGQVTLTGQLPFVWVPSTQDPTCLQKGAPAATDRIASVWYSSSSFIIDVNLVNGSHSVALYALDWDRSQRVEQIDVLDGSTGVSLDSRTVSGFSSGTYLVWNVTGHVQFRVTRLAGPNAVISGVFFGAGQAVVVQPSISQNPSNASVNAGQTASFTVAGLGGSLTYQWQSEASGAAAFSNIGGATGPTYTTPTLSASDSGTQFRCVLTNSAGSITSGSATLTVTPVQTSSSAVFAGTDNTTQGAWKSVYGADGYSITAVGSVFPAYAQVAITGSSIWNGGYASDPRAVLVSPGVGQIACWYSSPQFSVDLNLTDSNSHRIAFYFVDWGSASRNQTVTIRDSASGVVLDSKPLTNFVNGQYLVWNIQGHVTVTISLDSGPNAVLSAIFFQ